MLFKAETYRKYHFHELVKNNVLDDVNIMRLVKSKGLKGEVLLGNGQVFCRMYRSGNEAFEGFSKNLFPGFGNNVVGFQLYFYLIFWGWIALAISFNLQLLILATAMSLAIRMMISKLANQSVEENIMLHPLQMGYYAVIGLNSMYIHLTGKVAWKGRSYEFTMESNCFFCFAPGRDHWLYRQAIATCFQQVIPFHLLIITIVMCLDKSTKSRNMIIFIVVAYLIGFGAEVLGVKTHYLFGYYSYGSALGPKILDVPIMIGILWFSTAYASNQTAMKLFPNYQWVSILAAALIMVFFDFMIEPFAIRYGLWSWRDVNVPDYNYQSWFIVGLILSFLYQKLVKDSTNESAPYFLFSQILFFILLKFSVLF